MPPTTSASPFAPTTTPAPTAAPAYQPLNLKAYDESINPDANQSAAAIQGALGKFEASRRNPLDIYNDAVSQLGVGDVRSRVTNLRNQLLNTENLLNNVDSSVTGRTQGSLVTEAQRQRLVNLEREPITKDYGTQSESLNNENANLTDLLRQAESQSNLAVEGQTSRQQALQFALEQAQGREKSAEDTRRFQAQMALEQQKLAASSAAMRTAGLSLGAGSSAAPKINAVAVATDYARQAKDQLLRKGGAQPFARENVRDQLVNQFGLSRAQADAIIYKDVFPDNWAGGGSSSPAQQKSLMSAVGYTGKF